MDNKKPFNAGQNGRRKSGGSTQLRSPVIKRPSSAPVSIQGWLHKQGSEGLMLWKKRWFVLSEYCLFYYKGPEEEKLLGSILLPSYKVSPCTTDDKVYRKFAFKAEHANMRTYYFAAETRELMTRWMNALSLATILQEGGKMQNQIQPSMTSISSVTTQNSDSTTDFKAYHSSSGPITIQPTSQIRGLDKNNANINGWMPQPPGNSYQPLYANAPPKPKRLNNEGQYGSSPEASPTRRDDSENVIYGNRKQFQNAVSSNKAQEYSYKSNISPGPDLVHSMPQTLGRKTPDFLGVTEIRSPNYAGKISRKGGESYGYSDFNETDSSNNVFQTTKGQQNFLGYRKTFNQPIVNYQHSNQYYQSYQKAAQLSSPRDQYVDNNGSNYYKKGSQPPRPHSADFLDHDAKKYYLNKENREMSALENPGSKKDQYNVRPPRPKSSLDIMHSSDGYYWSEERYAEKMRQSAIYLQNSLPQRSQSSRTNTPNLKQLSETRNFSIHKSGESEENATKGKVLCEMADSPSVTQNLRRWSEHQDRLDNYFVRSASARLAKPRTLDDESDEVQAYTGGKDFDEGRKQDSMKRLLEWKQRMLQSPLTRKPSGSSTRGIAQNELSKCYKQQMLKELERREMENREDLGKKRLKADGKRIQNRSTDGRRSAILSSDRYYSYSSDEEENKGACDKRPQRPNQTGKSRKEIEEPKEKRVAPNPEKVYTSPDYENVTDAWNLSGRNKHLNGRKKSEEPPPRDGSTNSSTEERKFLKTEVITKQPEPGFNSENTPDGGSDDCYEVLRQTKDSSNSSFSDPTKIRNNNLVQATPSQSPVKKKQNWNEKIDETKLIKEFSYQYIKETKTPERGFLNSYKVLDAPPENIVKSRIKQLGLVREIEIDNKEAVMREPLKVSSPVYSLNEAHVSNLKNSDIKVQEKDTTLSKLSLDDSSKSLECNPKDAPEKHQKSVKDLLADFERKSQLFQEKEALEHEKSFEEIPGKRYVFSDTETLLYDSSSDAEGKKEEPDPSILNSLKKSDSRRGAADELTEEEDGDEEVAATLGRRERFFSSCRDLRRRRDPESSRNKQLVKHPGVEPSPSSEVETIMTPGYLRSSLTELVAALENSDSTCSTPTIDKIKDNLEKALPRENHSKTAEENLTESKEENCEGHYMPMTPSRRVSAPSSDKSRSNSSLHSFFLAAEETYVEMAENGFSTSYPEPSKSPLSIIGKTYGSHGGPGYCEIPNEQESHYDFLFRASSFREPEYMEVNTLLEILKEQDEKIKEQKDAVEDSSQSQNKVSQKKLPPTPPRSALPDILNSSSGGQRTTKSDSSDADDESSKDLDSLDVPRHPRFSLSDTFRPASYYLGSAINERKRNLIRLPNPCENHDSSDSDLVSPPPIPTSPPLLDDLDTSLETEKSLEIKPNISKTKADKDVSKMMWNKASQDMENEVNMQKKKRQPVSDDMLETFNKPEESFFGKQLVFGELDAAGSRNGLAFDEDNGDINLDKYLEELQLNGNMNVHLLSKNFSEKEMHKNLMPKENINKADSNEKALIKLKYSEENLSINETELTEQPETREEVQYENLQAFFPPPPPELYDSGNEQSDRDAGLVCYSNVAFPEVPPPDNYCDVYEPEVTENSKVCFNPVTLQHQTVPETVVNKPTVFENQGAPYYYSDIIKNAEDDINGLLSDRNLSGVRGFLNGYKYQTLNNQRGNVQETNQGSKRNDIGRKVNPISENSTSGTENSTVDLDEVQKITEELRTTSAHFMGAADKSGSVDLRNIYESDTLQRRKATVSEVRARTPDLHNLQSVARNLYPQGLKDKTVGPNMSAESCGDEEFSLRSRARSRSLEGLLSDIGYPSEDTTRCRPTNQTSNNLRVESDARSVKPQANHSRIPSCEGDEPWEKDALWRENLRKASLRHTRSLDNLDDEPSGSGMRRLNLSTESATSEDTESRGANHNAIASQSGRRSADHFSGLTRPKLSRDVTYVNENFRKIRQSDLAREYEHDYREGRVKPKKREGEVHTVVELSDSGVLDCDDGVHYEKLARNRVIGERSTPTGNYLEGFDKREPKRNRQENVGASSNQKSPGGDSLPAPQPQLNLNQGLCLKPIDREKLRQWDLMSSGIVDQGIVHKKVTNADHQDTCEKPLHLDEKSSPQLNKYVTPEVQSVDNRSQLQGSTHSLKASGSGSAVRESNLSTLTSVSPQILQNQKTAIESNLPPSMLTKQETYLDQKDGMLPDRSLNDFTEAIDYYDRGKSSYLPSNNGFTEWDEPYSERRADINGDDVIMNYVEKGRSIPENSYYVSQQQERKSGADYSRNCVTLPMTKNDVSGQISLATLQSIGRNIGPSDGRYTVRDPAIKRMSSSPWGLDVSAGELLGRTHEELVLLLIQLRRQSASICKAMEACHIEIEEQARNAALDTPTRLEHIRKLEKLKKHLLELEKQYEKGKPLVNLVDNMVKLGSLYKGNNHVYNTSLGLDYNPEVREKLEFNQKVQEQRLLAEERRDWDRLSPDHGQLQAKVQQLYRLDRLLQEESGTLHSLKQDKELLEKALGGLRHKLQVNRSNPVEADRCRKQQKLLEKELSRVRLLLAHNSKKLEETVAENARLEQELVILRQKLQASRVSSRSSVPLLPETTTWSTTAALEAELRRVQQLVGDLQRQRHELSAQVKQLTEKSDTLVQQIRPGPTGVAGAGPIPGKKKSCSTWLETDLDLLVTQDVSVESPITSHQNQPQPTPVSPGSRSTTPIYINTDNSKKDTLSPTEVQSPTKPSSSEETPLTSYCTPVELSEADERMKRFYGIIPKEKQEIKTVRIVKRESERRQRDRDRSGNIGIPIGNTAIAKRISVIEENDICGLEKVDEESYESNRYSPNFSEPGRDYQDQEYVRQEGKSDPYMNYHPTNPFLPQNLNQDLEEGSRTNGDVISPSTQKSLSLPRGFGKGNIPVQLGKSDSSSELRAFNSRRNRVRFENLRQNGGENVNSPMSDNSKNYNYSTEADYSLSRVHLKNFNTGHELHGSAGRTSPTKMGKSPTLMTEQRGHDFILKEGITDVTKPLTPKEQLFNTSYGSQGGNSPQLSPVYQSEAARQIIMEMSNNATRNNSNRRQIRKEKRRHHTVSHIRHVPESDDHLKMGLARSRDDLDMERALRPRINAPDVVRSTMSQKDLKYNESTIDNILGTPNKIIIPERYVPEQEQLTAEEQLQRLRKAESIRKMLSETTALSTPDLSGEGLEEEKKSCTLRKKVEEEKKQREHLLELNQILAQQVMEKSKLVAVKALAALPLEKDGSCDEEDLSPLQPLPIYQQRENFFS